MHTDRGFFVSGIGTGIGKTIVCSVLVRALKADYWKPVQCGNLDASDAMTVKALGLSNESKIHPERFKLGDPLSPHAAAKNAGVNIHLTDFTLPTSQRPIIVEGAGGILSPMGTDFLNIDLAAELNLPVILVSRHYLGSINHTLLSIEAITKRNLDLRYIIFVGENLESESFILKKTGIKKLATFEEVSNITLEQVRIWSDVIEKELEYVATAA